MPYMSVDLRTLPSWPTWGLTFVTIIRKERSKRAFMLCNTSHSSGVFIRSIKGLDSSRYAYSKVCLLQGRLGYSNLLVPKLG